MTLLLDASVWLAAVDRRDRFHAPAKALVDESAPPLAALDLTLYEVANVVTVRWRMPGHAMVLAQLVTTCCQGRILPTEPAMLGDAAALSAEVGISVYDAAYAAQARAHGWTLVSGDLADLVGKGLAIAPPEAAAAAG